MTNIDYFRKLLILFSVVLMVFLVGCSKSVEDVLSEQSVNHGSGIGNNIGNLAPDFIVTGIDGNQVTLNDYSGKPVLVYFMATWCPFCVRDYNELSDIYADYKEDVQIISISLDLKEGPKIYLII